MNTIASFPASARTSNRQSPDRAARTATATVEAAYDAELVRRFNGGDESAFVEIMSRYREKTFAITRGLLRNHADAEEITQDTFVRAHRAAVERHRRIVIAHRGLTRFRGDSSLATWLHRIAVNLARNRYWYYFRRRQHATLSLDCPLSDDSAATFTDLVAAEDPDPARAAATGEFSSLIQACMEKLPPPHREILTLRNILHRSYEEIATSLGVTVGTVKSRIARARENVRTLLTEMCPEFAPEAKLGEWFETARTTGRITLAVA